jgi:ferric-dicitrate binding protein FerR (iron transport regulator)
LIVIPPARVARHVISRPLVVACSRTPVTATRTRVGVNFNSTRTVLPRETVAVRVDAAIGAPQCAPQHHEETASGTRLAPTLT